MINQHSSYVLLNFKQLISKITRETVKGIVNITSINIETYNGEEALMLRLILVSKRTFGDLKLYNRNFQMYETI